MKKNREIFLFGAGAVIDWNAPPTSEITKLIRESGFTLKGSNIKITEFIYQRLRKCGYSDSEVNFETIINVIEELIVYNSEFNTEKCTPSLLKSFLSENDLCNIYNYSIRGGKREHGYEIQVTNGQDFYYSRPAYFGENTNQYFLQFLLAELLSQICNKVAQYSWNTPSCSHIDKDCDNSKNFRNWLKKIHKTSILRLYTLNYDNLFKSLLESDDIQCFDGFFKNKDVYSRTDVLKISSDTESNIHYNLHGSAYWKVLSASNDQMPNPEIVQLKGIHLQMNDSVATMQIEKGKTLQVSNIITGYQKSQKAKLTPFRQFHSAFDKDCYTADRITIVGYSFNVEHVNETLKIALRYNTNLKIEIVDLSFKENSMDKIFASRFFTFNESDDMNPKTISDNIDSYFDDKITAYNMRFSDFLKYRQIIKK
ncbi:SIR2 family protein [Sunxiuqinia indica]|uniref:SIR2 family protein n=1 Tax=Sunxiuqinia indica TaxID=2692584 RepID=UPI00135CCDE3|nr:SIR2 family protein [Sunxiuqinia indica]